MKYTNPKHLAPYKSTKGLEFDLSIWNWVEPDEAEYRMFFIKAENKKWGEKVFRVFITKAETPGFELASHLAESLALDEVKSRLNDSENGKSPLYLPVLNEGWCVV